MGEYIRSSIGNLTDAWYLLENPRCRNHEMGPVVEGLPRGEILNPKLPDVLRFIPFSTHYLVAQLHKAIEAVLSSDISEILQNLRGFRVTMKANCEQDHLISSRGG